MSVQVERFINITSDNLQNQLKLWDNVKEREIKGNGAIQVSLGIDFKRRGPVGPSGTPGGKAPNSGVPVRETAKQSHEQEPETQLEKESP
jgi:hypothetical protein